MLTTQQNSNANRIVVTPLGRADTRRSDIEQLTSKGELVWVASDGWGEATFVGRLPGGREVTYKKKVSVKKAQEMSVAIKDAMQSHAFTNWSAQNDTTIIIDIEHEASFTRIMDLIDACEVTFDRHRRAHIAGSGRLDRLPIYNYWRDARLARDLGMPAIAEERIGRMNAMFYKDNSKTWGVQIGDLNMLYRHIPDDTTQPSYPVRRELTRSLAATLCDSVLNNASYIQNYLRQHFPQVEIQIGQIREEIRRERIRAGRRAARGY
ncbi:hypothetical protein PMZ80_010091 [Knufia obscura]|uniref:LAGLIDADG homing endonuclease n=1 Tax=Knufia obscura TaxID=1635080 RepID=A0ABR0RB22_9EURO|nr:hypothetical protein PMZ80_010091 [Knufia obscura]